MHGSVHRCPGSPGEQSLVDDVLLRLFEHTEHFARLEDAVAVVVERCEGLRGQAGSVGVLHEPELLTLLGERTRDAEGEGHHDPCDGVGNADQPVLQLLNADGQLLSDPVDEITQDGNQLHLVEHPVHHRVPQADDEFDSLDTRIDAVADEIGKPEHRQEVFEDPFVDVLLDDGEVRLLPGERRRGDFVPDLDPVDEPVPNVLRPRLRIRQANLQ